MPSENSQVSCLIEPVKEKGGLFSDIQELPYFIIGTYALRIELEKPKQETLEKARIELRETPENIEKGLKELKEILRNEEDLYAPIDNDNWLIKFLRPTKFYPESAAKLVRNYYSFKVKHKNIYEGLLPTKEKKVFEHDILTVLPVRDQNQRRILILTLGKKWRHKELTLDEIFKGAVLLIEAAMLEPETQVHGVQVVFDMDGLSMSQVWQFTPPFAKRLVDLIQDSIALRVKGLHIVNQPYIFNMVFQLFKPFLREKLKNRIYFHGTDRSSLHKHISADTLPEWYGGTLDMPPFHSSIWLDLLECANEEFSLISSYGYKQVSKSKK